MIITLEKNAIVLTPQNNSINMTPLLYFVENSFKKVKYYSNATVIFSESSEEIKKKYLLKWAYKIHKKNLPYSYNNFYKKLIASFTLPIHIMNTSNKTLTPTATVTIIQINSFEISVSTSQYQIQIAQYFKSIFKDTMSQGIQKTTFKIVIKTKSNLLLLKKILSSREILNIKITFIAHGLSFQRLHPQEEDSAEYIYKEKLKKSYKLLSISDKSTANEMKKNYKNMLKKYHPDIVYNQSEDMIKLYTRRFQVIQNAYELVKEHHKIA